MNQEFLKRLYARMCRLFSRENDSESELSNIQKTAVFFLTLPPDSAARLISNLSSHEIQNITREMSQLSCVTPLAQKEVIREFCGFLSEEGRIPKVTAPTQEMVRHIADQDPKGVMGTLRKHWLSFKLAHPLPRENVERIGPEDRAAIILSHLPGNLLKRILPQLSTDEIQLLGKGMIQLSSVPDDIQQNVWNGLSRWFRGNLEDQDSIVKGIHHLLRQEILPDYSPPLDNVEKAALLLRLLKPKNLKEIGKTLLENVERSDQESLILALRQSPHEMGEREKNKLLDEFFTFMHCSFVPKELSREEDLLKEAERRGLHMPKEVAECLRILWLTQRSNLTEWREMATNHPNFAAEKLVAFLQQKGGTWEPLTHFEKAALFLRLIHPEIRVEILKHLDELDNELLAFEIKRAWRISMEEKQSVLEEFLGGYYFHSTARLLEGTGSEN